MGGKTRRRGKFIDFPAGNVRQWSQNLFVWNGHCNQHIYSYSEKWTHCQKSSVRQETSLQTQLWWFEWKMPSPNIDSGIWTLGHQLMSLFGELEGWVKYCWRNNMLRSDFALLAVKVVISFLSALGITPVTWCHDTMMESYPSENISPKRIALGHGVLAKQQKSN